MKLEYIYNDEWKELKKQKKYEEAATILSDEIIYNLARVHNCFSDLKIKPVDVVSDFSVNSDGELMEELKDFYFVYSQIIGGGAYYDELEWEDEEKYNPRDRLKLYEKTQKELIKLFKKRLNK